MRVRIHHLSAKVPGRQPTQDRPRVVLPVWHLVSAQDSGRLPLKAQGRLVFTRDRHVLARDQRLELSLLELEVALDLGADEHEPLVDALEAKLLLDVVREGRDVLALVKLAGHFGDERRLARTRDTLEERNDLPPVQLVHLKTQTAHEDIGPSTDVLLEPLVIQDQLHARRRDVVPVTGGRIGVERQVKVLARNERRVELAEFRRIIRVKFDLVSLIRLVPVLADQQSVLE